MTHSKSIWNDLIEQEVGARVPAPCGPYILLKIYKRPEKTKAGIILANNTLDQEKYNNRVGQVLAMGPECYPTDRFPSGPRCQVGDWVIFRRYEIALLSVNGIDLGFLYDDKICCVLDDPTQLDHTSFIGKN